MLGRRAWLVGLTSEPGLNGSGGTCEKVAADKHGELRITLRLDTPYENQTGKCMPNIQVKPGNLCFTPPAAAFAAAPAVRPFAARAVACCTVRAGWYMERR